MNDIQGWRRGQKTPVKQAINVGDTILPAPQNLPLNYGGEDDSSLYRRPPGTPNTSSWLYTFIIAHIPLPPLGSVLPYIYTSFMAHFFFRSILVVIIAIFAWALFTTLYAFIVRSLNIPINWPRSKPPLPRDVVYRSKKIHVSVGRSSSASSVVHTRTVVDSHGNASVYDPSYAVQRQSSKLPHIMKSDPTVYWVDFETIFITTALWNPILGIVGMFLSWFSVRALDIEPFYTRLVADAPEVNVLLVFEFIIFAVITLKLGKNTLWLWTAIGVPVYILAVMAPINQGYTHGYDEFKPYLYWLLVTIYFAAWFFRDPFGIEEILEYGHLNPKTLRSKYHYDSPYFDHGMQQHPYVDKKDPRRNSYYFWSLDGTYMWNAFFSVTILVMILSLYKVIDLST